MFEPRCPRDWCLHVSLIYIAWSDEEYFYSLLSAIQQLHFIKGLPPALNLLVSFKTSGYICNLFTHRAPRSSQELRKKCPRAFQDQIGIWKCWFFRRGENRSTWRKISQSRVENQPQTQTTYDTRSGNRTWDTLVGGERSHQCAIPTPQSSLLE